MALNELRMMNDKNHFDVSYNSLLYLNVIAATADCTISTLAESLNITKSAATIKANELARQGLLERQKSESDKRVNFLSLSERAQKIFRFYDDMTIKIASEIERKYSEEQIKIFCEILESFGSCCVPPCER